ncbi:hypothetical protein ACFSSF_16905 [Dietzia aerolata]|uniref:hypothetical protein n=1 Tax=Dietzia aerolata TaxID=595984 RepID=UPI0036429918
MIRSNSPCTPNDGSDHTSGSRIADASVARGPRCRRTSTASSGVSPTLVMVPDTVTSGTPDSVPTAWPPENALPSMISGVISSIAIRANAGAGLGI